MSTPRVFKAAAVQAAPAFLDLDAGVDKSLALMSQAREQDVELLAFPETWLPGYPWFIWLGAPAWALQYIPRYVENSLEIGSPQWHRLLDGAREHELAVVLGYSERDGGSLYMSQAFIRRDGTVAATRRKLKPTHVERTVFGEGDGSHLAVHDLDDLGRVGALCCWEHLQPLTKYAMYAMNEQVHVAAWPTFSLYKGIANALGAEANIAASRMYALEGGCYVLAACGVVSREMTALLCDTDERKALLTTGGGFAAVFAPDGRQLTEPLDEHADALAIAEIDLGFIAIAKAAADPAGHYARADVTQLLLNRSPLPRVVEITGRPRHEPVSDDVDGEGEPAVENGVLTGAARAQR